ncbi:EAL and modified HD-GYP domain-containing signal transduction protein [Cytobacillus eiseniae]|uniref:EAL and modified HD-GYP domain-containing signal transduction protein n=1 Tax=Cytobacillus eiseniae TaxID=762947 RepID=A0ABS4R998_9BACI|nr:HDOD domain-containing protein [Cytobacillus eiseniae]MBP2239463.1 EAL and modified HD-GYP domain-containing signal transduction protein [Cytobacillus eiseniae]
MEVFVARQPIFNIKEEVFGYELLYRSNQRENAFPDVDGDQATTELIINSFLNIGIDKLSSGKPCFINFTENLLSLRLPTYFRPREIIVEILETVAPSPKLIEICMDLKDQGYRIALDDFVLNELNQYTYELLNYVDIIKVDFLTTPIQMREKIEAVAKDLNIMLLAEKVETREGFEEAKKHGYEFFQGYFFAKPVILSTHDLPTYYYSYYEMIQNLSMTEPSIDRITELIERDLSLSYKLLKLINSPAYRPKQKINSIRQAVVLLGLIELQKWIYVLAVHESTIGKKNSSKEMIQISLIRARLCEEIEKHRNKRPSASNYFLTGMFSMMDSLIGMPMEKILHDLPLDEEICEALIGKNNQLKFVLDLVLAVEKAEWTFISQKCKELNIDEKLLFKMYSEAISWANDLVLNE